MNTFTRFIHEEEGADAVEYALVIALIALAIVVGATAMGTAISGKLKTMADQVTSAGTAPPAGS